jgi:hypothetical protein
MPDFSIGVDPVAALLSALSLVIALRAQASDAGRIKRRYKKILQCPFELNG